MNMRILFNIITFRVYSISIELKQFIDLDTRLGDFAQFTLSLYNINYNLFSISFWVVIYIVGPPWVEQGPSDFQSDEQQPPTPQTQIITIIKMIKFY